MTRQRKRFSFAATFSREVRVETDLASHGSVEDPADLFGQERCLRVKRGRPRSVRERHAGVHARVHDCQPKSNSPSVRCRDGSERRVCLLSMAFMASLRRDEGWEDQRSVQDRSEKRTLQRQRDTLTIRLKWGRWTISPGLSDWTPCSRSERASWNDFGANMLWGESGRQEPAGNELRQPLPPLEHHLPSTHLTSRFSHRSDVAPSLLVASKRLSARHGRTSDGRLPCRRPPLGAFTLHLYPPRLASPPPCSRPRLQDLVPVCPGDPLQSRLGPAVAEGRGLEGAQADTSAYPRNDRLT